MTFLKLCVAVLALGMLAGCKSSQPHYQRFLPIPTDGFSTDGIPWHGYFALDTETGSLCRTVTLEHFPRGSADDLAHSILSCSDILGAEKEAAKH